MRIKDVLKRLGLSPWRSFEERFPRKNWPTLYEDDSSSEALEKTVDGTWHKESSKHFPSRSSD